MMKGYRLQVTGYSSFLKGTIVLIILLSTIHCPLSTASALESTKSAKQASPSSSLVQKLEALKAEIASKAASLKTEVNKKIENKVFVGKVVQIEDSKITLQTHIGLKSVSVNEYTLYQVSLKKGVKKSQFSLNDLSKDNLIAALGDVDDKGVLVAKKIIKLTPSQKKESQLIWGKITSANKGLIGLKIKDGSTIQVLRDAKTVFSLGGNEGSFSDAKLNKFIVVRGVLNKGQIAAYFIYIEPSKSTVK